MSRFISFSSVSLLAISLFFGLHVTPAKANQHPSRAPAIQWVPQAVSHGLKPRSLRRHKVRPQLTNRFKVNPLRLKTAIRIPLNINNEIVYAVREKLVPHVSGGFSWLGILETNPDSQVSISSRGHHLMGHIEAKGVDLQIKTAGSLNLFQLITPDRTNTHKCGNESDHTHEDGTKGPLSKAKKATHGKWTPHTDTTVKDSGTPLFNDDEISIMVLYTEDAKWGAFQDSYTGFPVPGSFVELCCRYELYCASMTLEICEETNFKEPIELEIEHNMALLNQGFSNSYTEANAVLVHTAQVEREEDESPNLIEYLYWLQEKMNQKEVFGKNLVTGEKIIITHESRIHRLREEHQADLVSLWINNPEPRSRGYVIGRGFFSTRRSNPAAYGATVVVRGWDSSLTFNHEIGHNLGLSHDWYVSRAMEPYIYQHGYVNFEKEVRSIMAYNDLCNELDIYCRPLNVFSTPDYYYRGSPMGNKHVADNARVIDHNWQMVANYKKGKLKKWLEDSVAVH